MTQTNFSVRCSRARKALMMRCASAALATAALSPQAVRAQAFQGSITSSTGSVTRTMPSTTTETLTIGTSTATINWSTNPQQGGGPINFLPAGNTATFTSTPGLADYTVLNRILPGGGQAIALNGHVISTLQGTNATGGNVWFFSPGGIVIGATAVFDVGGLLLTTNNVTNFGTTATGFNASFATGADLNTKVQIQNGAQINALQQNSYVAIVAPRIEQGGTVQVNGSAAYVAGQQVSLTMNQGLFDIQVDVGTNDPNGIVHTGTTGGPANTTAADNHTIYMVAVPKNQALTMLLGGTVGFDDAVSANVQNGAIFLSSGAGISDSGNNAVAFAPSPGLDASIRIGPGDYTSDLTAFAQQGINAVADTGDITFGGNLLFNASNGSNSVFADVVASNGNTLRVAGSATLDADGSQSGASGFASIAANSGGLVSIGGNASLLSSDSAASGGVSGLVADGGAISVGGLTTLNARGSGGTGISSQAGGADGSGGAIGVSALNGGSITTGSMALDASGHGQSNNGGGAAGGGYGGSISVDAESGSSLTVNGNLSADASGTGGNAAAQGGNGQGGTVNLFAGGDLTVHGNLVVNVNGTGGNGSSGGSGQGGDIALVADGGHLGGHHLTLTANGEPGLGGFGGNGGRISIDAAGGAVTADVLSIEADGSDSGGNVSLTSESDFQGNAGSLGFGTTSVLADSSDGAGGSIFVASGDTTGIDLGDANLRATGAFGGEIDLLAGMCVECGGEGALAFQSAALGGGGGIAAGNLAMSTSGNITISLNGGDVAASGTLQGDAGQAIVLGDTGMGGAIRAHDIELTGITIDDSASVFGDIINFTSAGDMNVAALTATDQMNLTAGGNLTAGDLMATNALTLNSGGNLQTNDLGGQRVAVTATGSTSVGNVLAPGSASFTAGGLATFNGIVNSPTITVTSSDIDVAQGASLGLSGVTDLLTFNAVSNGLPIVIGNGPAAEGQYQLNEDGNIRATSIVINAQGADSSSADVQVFDTKVEGSNTSGGGITNVTLNTGGSVFVDGLVDFNNAGTTDSLTINAGHSIEVNTDTGGIQITDSTGKLTGALALTADNIWVASGSVLNQLETNVNFLGRDTALGVNSGTANQNGFVRAGAITAGVADSFLVQNSGTPQLFAGIDTGPGGLSIASTGTTPAALIVYGRQTNATGTLITNQDFLGSVAVTGTGGFTTDSSVNGCEIGSTNCGKLTFTIDMASILGPLNDNGDDKKKKKDKQGDQGDDGSSADPSLRLINTTPINNAPPITEPVTSGGDVIVGGAPN